MKTFDVIIQKIINKENIIYKTDDKYSVNFWSEIYGNSELSNEKYITKHMFYSYITNSRNESKFTFLNRTVLNMFFTEKDKEEIFYIFSKVQSAYHAFSRLANIYRFKKSELQINHDLYLTPITTQKYITILQNGKKYMFTATDLINIINTALSNAPHFFVEPLIAKNPYNNMPFEKSTLYNIYFFIRTTNYKMPILIEKYFLANFDITSFYFENESIIRDIAIDNFVFKSDTKVLYPSVINMIKKYDKKNILDISDDFPKCKLVDIMRPYLHLYYITKYSFMFNKKENAYNELQYKIKKFVKFNPKFGRKYIISNPFTKKTDISFDENHINFYNIKPRKYETSHLILNMENEYNNIYEYDSDADYIEEDQEQPLFNLNLNNTTYRTPFGSIINSYEGGAGRSIISFDMSSNNQSALYYSAWSVTNAIIHTEENDNIEVDTETDTDSDDEIVVEDDNVGDDTDNDDDDTSYD